MLTFAGEKATINGMKMKRLVLTNVLLLLFTSTLMAQQANEPRNPVEGYVITNNNDTIHGTIDYLTGHENAFGCRFQSEGETVFKTLRPDDIQGYRLSDNGAYYVSRTLPIDGKDTKIFAEYLLQGGISLYRYEGNAQTLYFMVDGNGKIATIKDEQYDKYKREEAMPRKRANLREAAEMMFISPEAQRDLWQKNITASNLVKVTRRYNEQYCTEAGDCVEYQYDSNKSSDFSVKLIADLGSNIGYVTNGKNKRHVKIPHVGIGGEFTSLRANPNLTYQLMAIVGPWESDMHIFSKREKQIWVEMDLGVLYRFNQLTTTHRSTPFVSGGISLSYLVGAYAGGGYEFQVGSHRLCLSATGRYGGYVIMQSTFFNEVDLGHVLSCSLDLTFVL